MPVPRFDLPKYKSSEKDLKGDIIFRKLHDMHYNVLDERHVISIIKKIITLTIHNLTGHIVLLKHLNNMYLQEILTEK